MEFFADVMHLLQQELGSNQPFLVICSFRLILAALCGGLIGIERGRKRRPAGLRTHMLVCVASALVILINEFLAEKYQSDPTRMAAQVISGIGFLGAGTILVDQKNHVKGLTTAAGLWGSACIGLAIGSGYYWGGFFSSVLLLIIFVKFVPVEDFFTKNVDKRRIKVSFHSDESLLQFMQSVLNKGYKILSFEILEEKELGLV